MQADVKRICLLGAESTGKTTLAWGLAKAYGTTWVPEYGRPYTEFGRDRDAPWTSEEFTRIARMQCWYEDWLTLAARGRLFCDTDAFTTALFHEVYLGEPTHAFDDLDEHGDPVTLGDGLAETPCTRHRTVMLLGSGGGPRIS